jgi:protein-disulfide isomerase
MLNSGKQTGGFSMKQRDSRLICGSSAFRGLKKLAILVIALSGLSQGNTQTRDKSPRNSVCGTLDAPIRLDVFSDFQCSYCRAFYLETVLQVRKNYAPEDKICIIYHEFPLDTHAYGRKAARYSVAAQRIGKNQWLAVMDALYTKQDQWSLDGNIDAALEGAVSAEDLDKIRKNLQDPAVDEVITRDIGLGKTKGVTGTPTVFMTALNKERLKAPYLTYKAWQEFFARFVK